MVLYLEKFRYIYTFEGTDEDEPGKGILIASIVIIILAVLDWAFIIRNWNRLPWK